MSVVVVLLQRPIFNIFGAQLVTFKNVIFSFFLLLLRSLLPQRFNSSPFSPPTAVTAKLRRRRRHHTAAGEPGAELQVEVEGRVEFVRQGPLLPYDTRHLLQQWLLVNVRCAGALLRPGRSQLYVLTGSVRPDGALALGRLFPWHKKDANIAAATRKWKQHRC